MESELFKELNAMFPDVGFGVVKYIALNIALGTLNPTSNI